MGFTPSSPESAVIFWKAAPCSATARECVLAHASSLGFAFPALRQASDRQSFCHESSLGKYSNALARESHPTSWYVKPYQNPRQPFSFHFEYITGC